MTDDSHWKPCETRSAVALAVVKSYLDDEHAVCDLRRYYTVDSDYSGAAFLELGENDPAMITPADLLAVSTLSVTIPVMGMRRLFGLIDSETSTVISKSLMALPPDRTLQELHTNASARDTHLQHMAKLYTTVKASLAIAGKTTSNAWVTASKICARKRPHLFPVRDNVVLDELKLLKSYPSDWPVFAHLMADDGVRAKLATLVEQASDKPAVDVGDPGHLLRHLDVVLWMGAWRHRGADSRCRDHVTARVVNA